MSSQAAPHADFGTVDVNRSVVVRSKGERHVPLPVKIAKVSLWLVSWGVTIWWFSLWFRLPTNEGRAFKKKVAAAVGQSSFWGKYGDEFSPYILKEFIINFNLNRLLSSLVSDPLNLMHACCYFP